MGMLGILLKSDARRQADRNRKRRQALTRARTAVRRERRSIAKRQAKAEELRHKAVDFERQGKPALARQLVRQFVQIDKETIARTMATNNMEYTLEQVQMKDNYDEFVRGMDVVARIEELARQGVDPDEVRDRLMDLAQRNQDLVEPWIETTCSESPGVETPASMSAEEQRAYSQVINDAASDIAADGPGTDEADIAKMSQELEKKMNEALA